jgi:hypothetical protein
VAPGAALVGGGSVVIRERFSAGKFWDDVVEWDCTLFQYIGELCRYLLSSPPHPRETQHRLRLCCGNGLRSDVWIGFQGRFQIPKIFEFYAATEANFSLYNSEGKPGAIGRIPPFLPTGLRSPRSDRISRPAIRSAIRRASACDVRSIRLAKRLAESSPIGWGRPSRGPGHGMAPAPA